MTFHELLRWRRLAKYPVMAHAAEAAGVHRSTWCLWEQGKHVPSVSDLYRIADTLGVTPNDLLTYNGEFVTVTKRRRRAGVLALTEVKPLTTCGIGRDDPQK